MASTPTTRSAGIIVYRRRELIEILIGHLGGPYWARKDAGAWSIPKGLVDADVDADEFAAACREFEEEMGHSVPAGDYADLGVFEQSRRKEIHIWAVEGDIDASTCTSNTFEMEWPPKSGRQQSFPEIDHADWFSIAAASDKVVAGQRPVLAALNDHLSTSDRPV